MKKIILIFILIMILFSFSSDTRQQLTNSNDFFYLQKE